VPRCIATTRFPQDAVLRFSKEQDYAQWSHRLEAQCDLRHLISVELFISSIVRTEVVWIFLIYNVHKPVRIAGLIVTF
jgi:hypothetical protein